MSLEIGQLSNAQDQGLIVIANDSLMPNITLYSEGNLIECRGSHNMKPEVRSGVGWQPNSFEIFRKVNKEGEVKNWEFSIAPTITPEVDDNILLMLQDVHPSLEGRGRIEVGREIGKSLPRIIMGKYRRGVTISFPGIGHLNVEAPTDFGAQTGSEYAIVDLPLDPHSFLPVEIPERSRFHISSRLRLARASLELLKSRIDSIIQDGTFTEARLRKIVDIQFSLSS